MKTLEYYAKQTEGPGKFEGEKPLTVFLWEESMNGVGEVLSDPEVDGFHAEGFDLTSEEMETFQTEEREWVMIEDQQGFVFTIPLAKFEASLDNYRYLPLVSNFIMCLLNYTIYTGYVKG